MCSYRYLPWLFSANNHNRIGKIVEKRTKVSYAERLKSPRRSRDKFTKLVLGVSLLLLSSSLASAQISVEPDDFPEGADISNAVAGVALSTVGSGWNEAGPGILAVNPSTKPEPFSASTGSLVFGTDDGSFPHLFMDAEFLQLRADFAAPAISVSLDFIGNNASDFGELKAYDSSDTLIDSAFTGQLTTSAVETLTVSGPGIAYIIAGGTSGGDSLGMDNMLVEVTIDVAIDIKPGSCPNPINVNSRGVLPVAILGNALDVDEVDVSTILLEGVSPLRWDLKDVATPFEPYIGREDAMDCTTSGPDGFMDLTLKFYSLFTGEFFGTIVGDQLGCSVQANLGVLLAPFCLSHKQALPHASPRP